MPQYFHKRGRSYAEAINKIQKEYGKNFRITTYKKLPAPGVLGWFGKEIWEIQGFVDQPFHYHSTMKKQDNVNKMEILNALGVKQPPVSKENNSSNNSQEELFEVLTEMKKISRKLELNAQTPPPEPFPYLSELEKTLLNNDFGKEYVCNILTLIKDQFTAAELSDFTKVQNKAALLIADSINFTNPEDILSTKIVVLVGPTGVGKTTTIAKLAAVYGLTEHARKVQIFTIDNFRIAAVEQVKTYGEIMGIPVTEISEYEDLKMQLSLASDADLILVDTIGNSPRATIKIEDMNQLLSACGKNTSMYLTLSATTKSSDLREIIKQYNIFGCNSVVITKLDETLGIGNLISILSEFEIGISYITTGQNVPVDISVASPKRLVGMIKGLEFDPQIFEEYFTVNKLTGIWRN